MNIKLHDVINDINGKTGSAIVNAIINGQRDPGKLASYRNGRIQCSAKTLIKSLEGNWRDEQLFCLKMARDRHLELEQHLLNIDKESERVIALLPKPILKKRK